MSVIAARRVLFTGGGGAASEALARLLPPRWEPHFADANPDGRPAGVPASRWHHVPMAADPDFPERVRDLCVALDAELLVPGVDEELEGLAATREVWPCPVLLPAAVFVARHLDKGTSMDWLRARGVAVPPTTPAAETPSAYPVIVKPRRGRGSRQVAVATSPAHLRALVEATARPWDDFIVQTRLDGLEYTVTVVADRLCRLRAVVPIRVEVKRGITLRATTEASSAVVDYVRAVHAADPVAGVFNVQLVVTEAGPQAFEINPRISTTTCLALAAGVPFLDLFLDEAPGRPGLTPYQPGLRLRRSWVNEFVSA